MRSIAMRRRSSSSSVSSSGSPENGGLAHHAAGGVAHCHGQGVDPVAKPACLVGPSRCLGCWSMLQLVDPPRELGDCGAAGRSAIDEPFDDDAEIGDRRGRRHRLEPTLQLLEALREPSFCVGSVEELVDRRRERLQPTGSALVPYALLVELVERGPKLVDRGRTRAETRFELLQLLRQDAVVSALDDDLGRRRRHGVGYLLDPGCKGVQFGGLDDGCEALRHEGLDLGQPCVHLGVSDRTRLELGQRGPELAERRLLGFQLGPRGSVGRQSLDPFQPYPELGVADGAALELVERIAQIVECGPVNECLEPRCDLLDPTSSRLVRHGSLGQCVHCGADCVDPLQEQRIRHHGSGGTGRELRQIR